MVPTQYSCLLFAFILPATWAAQTISSNQFNLFPGPAELDINTPLDSSQDSASLFDGNDGVTNVLLSLDIPVPDILPSGFPKFIDPEGILRWLNKPKRPDCDDGKFLFCCQLGPPRPLLDPSTPYESEERMVERQRRMRECVPWSEEEPACHFPENQGCCDCRSIELKTVFGCYIPEWRDNPDYRDYTYPGPLRLLKLRMPPKRHRKSRARPKPGQQESDPPPTDVPGEQDPNPSELEPSEQDLPGQKKRDWSLTDSGDMGTTTDLLFAAKPHPRTRPVQQDPNDPRCSDEYLWKGLRCAPFAIYVDPTTPRNRPSANPARRHHSKNRKNNRYPKNNLLLCYHRDEKKKE